MKQTNKRSNTMKAVATISAVIAALVLSATAAAIPDPGSDGNVARALTDAARPSPEIPYLSHGIGVDDRAVSRAAESAATTNPLSQLRRAEASQAREDARKAAAAAAGVGLTPDFWNYDPQTGEKIANASPGLSPEELAEVYVVPMVVVRDGGGFAWDNAAEGATVGFGFAMILTALALLIVRSRPAVGV